MLSLSSLFSFFPHLMPSAHEVSNERLPPRRRPPLAVRRPIRGRPRTPNGPPTAGGSAGAGARAGPTGGAARLLLRERGCALARGFAGRRGGLFMLGFGRRGAEGDRTSAYSVRSGAGRKQSRTAQARKARENNKGENQINTRLLLVRDGNLHPPRLHLRGGDPRAAAPRPAIVTRGPVARHRAAGGEMPHRRHGRFGAQKGPRRRRVVCARCDWDADEHVAAVVAHDAAGRRGLGRAGRRRLIGGFAVQEDHAAGDDCGKAQHGADGRAGDAGGFLARVGRRVDSPVEKWNTVGSK